MRIGYIMQEGGPDVRQRPLTGPANHVWQVIQGLKQAGHSTRLLARYDGVIWISNDLENFRPVQVRRWDQGFFHLVERVVRGIQSRLRLPYLNLFESWRFAEACKQELSGCDLLYERLGWMGHAGRLAARKMAIPLVLEANNGDFVTELERLGVKPGGLQLRLALALMRRQVHQASHIVATGDGHRTRFIEWWRVEPQKVSVVENGSDVVNILSRDQLRSFRAESDETRRVKIVFVGAFEPWHGLQVLLAAIPPLVVEMPDIHLVLIGTGSLLKQIQEQITRSGLEKFVTLTGSLNIHQVSEILAQSDIGVAPYCGWMEFSGLKIFDYKSAGLAIIASGQDGQPATLKDQVTALIVPPCDEAALYDALKRLVGDPELRQKLGRAARLEAEQAHSWKHTVDGLEKVFQDVVARASSKPAATPHGSQAL